MSFNKKISKDKGLLSTKALVFEEEIYKGIVNGEYLLLGNALGLDEDGYKGISNGEYLLSVNVWGLDKWGYDGSYVQFDQIDQRICARFMSFNKILSKWQD